MKLDVNIVEKGKGYYLIAFDGQLDTKTSEFGEQRIAEIMKPITRFLIFDMSNLSYISSMGIRLIYKTEKTIAGSGGKVLMVNIQPQIEKILRIAAVLPKYQIFQTVEEADRHIREITNKET